MVHGNVLALLMRRFPPDVSNTTGVPLEDVIIPGYDVVYVNYSNTVENSSSAEKRRVVSDCDFETRLITSSASEAESWAATVQSEQWIYQVAWRC